MSCWYRYTRVMFLCHEKENVISMRWNCNYVFVWNVNNKTVCLGKHAGCLFWLQRILFMNNTSLLQLLYIHQHQRRHRYIFFTVDAKQFQEDRGNLSSIYSKRKLNPLTGDAGTKWGGIAWNNIYASGNVRRLYGTKLITHRQNVSMNRRIPLKSVPFVLL